MVINYQKIKQISRICQPAVYVTAIRFEPCGKDEIIYCHYFMYLVFSYSIYYFLVKRERERERYRADQKTFQSCRKPKQLCRTFLLTRFPLPCSSIDITQHPRTSIRLGKVECQNATAVRIGLRQKAGLPGHPLDRLTPSNKRRVCQK